MSCLSEKPLLTCFGCKDFWGTYSFLNLVNFATFDYFVYVLYISTI